MASNVPVQVIPYNPERELSGDLAFQRYAFDTTWPLGKGRQVYGNLQASHQWVDIIRAEKRLLKDHIGDLLAERRAPQLFVMSEEGTDYEANIYV